jgi:hypothetical protein
MASMSEICPDDDGVVVMATSVATPGVDSVILDYSCKHGARRFPQH